MLYENKNIKHEMLAVLENRIASIADSITALLNEGYIPNKNKFTIIDWTSILIDSYENIDVLSENQHKKLDKLFNKILKM